MDMFYEIHSIFSALKNDHFQLNIFDIYFCSKYRLWVLIKSALESWF